MLSSTVHSLSKIRASSLSLSLDELELENELITENVDNTRCFLFVVLDIELSCLYYFLMLISHFAP